MSAHVTSVRMTLDGDQEITITVRRIPSWHEPKPDDVPQDFRDALRAWLDKAER